MEPFGELSVNGGVDDTSNAQFDLSTSSLPRTAPLLPPCLLVGRQLGQAIGEGGRPVVVHDETCNSSAQRDGSVGQASRACRQSERGREVRRSEVHYC